MPVLYFLLLVTVVVLVYLAYRQGFLVSRSIAALLFVFHTGKTMDRASLDSCTGWFRHRIRLNESRLYEFRFDCQLTKGNVEITVLDLKKQVLLSLGSDSASGRINLNHQYRYYLHWKFRSATGKCVLRW